MKMKRTIFYLLMICLICILIPGNSQLRADYDDEKVILKELLESYYNIQYQCLSDFKEREIKSFYDMETPEGQKSYGLDKETLSYVIGYRGLQENDLKLKEYSFNIDIQNLEIVGDKASVVLLESNQVKFNFTPDRMCKKHNVEHVFTFRKGREGWKITNHDNKEDEVQLIKEGITGYRGYSSYEGAKEYYLELERSIKEKKSNKLRNKKTDEEYIEKEKVIISNKEDKKEQLNLYDREKAATYAHDWSDNTEKLRNSPPWGNYDKYDMGGDCTNFVSQCIYAGGIPMDYTGKEYEQWKWYSSVYNPSPKPTGRVASWTGVSALYNYCVLNKGFGMASQVDVAWNDLYLGDVVQFSKDKKTYFHTVVISGHLYEDKSNELKESFISSHTTDRDWYPLSAYSYPFKRYIHIAGWRSES